MTDNFQNRAGGQSKEKHPIWRWIWLREGFQKKKRKKSGRRVVKNQTPILKKVFFTPTSPQNGGVGVCFIHLPLLDEK